MIERIQQAAWCLILTVPSAFGGEFDRLEGDALARIAKSNDSQSHAALSVQELDSLPIGLAETRAAFAVVRTGQGNYARLLVSPALRKSMGGDGQALPVVVLERFDTFEPGASGSRLAKGANVVLFEGFQIDLDSGLIVPPGQGGDLEFVKAGKGGGSLKALGSSVLITLTKPMPNAPAQPGPSPGKSVLPGDFSGRFTLFADGRWSGMLELQVSDDRQLSGRFRSEANGTSYPVKGQVSAETPQKAAFTIKFPRSEQQYDAFLFSAGKTTLAGSFLMGDRPFGFYAIRGEVRSRQAPESAVSPK